MMAMKLRQVLFLTALVATSAAGLAAGEKSCYEGALEDCPCLDECDNVTSRVSDGRCDVLCGARLVVEGNECSCAPALEELEEIEDAEGEMNDEADEHDDGKEDEDEEDEEDEEDAPWRWLSRRSSRRSSSRRSSWRSR